MYIETFSIEKMIGSLCSIFDISSVQLHMITQSICQTGYKDRIAIDLTLIEDQVNCYFKDSYKIIDSIDEICFHHLSRRMENADCSCLCIRDLLTTNSDLYKFLKQRNIEFMQDGWSLNLYINGVIRRVDGRNVNRLINRLGQCQAEFVDQYVDGYAFADRIDKNNYYLQLYRGPEFIDDLARYLDDSTMVADYMRISKYYLLTYRVSFKQVIIDNMDNATDIQKKNMLLTVCLMRLFEYYNNRRHLSEYNLLLRIGEHGGISSDRCIRKSEIVLSKL